jgi:hypothetical protein
LGHSGFDPEREDPGAPSRSAIVGRPEAADKLAPDPASRKPRGPPYPEKPRISPTSKMLHALHLRLLWTIAVDHRLTEAKLNKSTH